MQTITIQSENYIIKKYNKKIRKDYQLNTGNTGICHISLSKIPDYLQNITIAIGGMVNLKFDIDEIELNKNLLDNKKCQLSKDLFNESGHNILISFNYNSSEIYKNSDIQIDEVIEKRAEEDTNVIVEYWDLDDECVYKACGVKYVDVTVKKYILKSPIELDTPEIIIKYN